MPYEYTDKNNHCKIKVMTWEEVYKNFHDFFTAHKDFSRWNGCLDTLKKTNKLQNIDGPLSLHNNKQRLEDFETFLIKTYGETTQIKNNLKKADLLLEEMEKCFWSYSRKKIELVSTPLTLLELLVINMAAPIFLVIGFVFSPLLAIGWLTWKALKCCIPFFRPFSEGFISDSVKDAWGKEAQRDCVKEKVKITFLSQIIKPEEKTAEPEKQTESGVKTPLLGDTHQSKNKDDSNSIRRVLRDDSIANTKNLANVIFSFLDEKPKAPDDHEEDSAQPVLAI